MYITRVTTPNMTHIPTHSMPLPPVIMHDMSASSNRSKLPAGCPPKAQSNSLMSAFAHSIVRAGCESVAREVASVGRLGSWDHVVRCDVLIGGIVTARYGHRIQ